MSLISLTFGDGACDPYKSPHLWIETPADRAARRFSGEECTAEVEKVCKFYGREGVYVIAKVRSGCVKEGMRTEVAGKGSEISELESKYGAAAKEGMNCGITLTGLEPSDLQIGEIIKFC